MYIEPYSKNNYYCRKGVPKSKTLPVKCLAQKSLPMPPAWALKSNITFKCETQRIPEYEMERFLAFLIKPAEELKNYQAVCEENKKEMTPCSTIDSINDLKINSKIKACTLLEEMWQKNKYLKIPLTNILVDIVKDDPDHKYIYMLVGKATEVLEKVGYSDNEITELLKNKPNKSTNKSELGPETLELNVKTGKIQNNEPFENLTQGKIERLIRAQMRKDKMDLNALSPYIKSENPDNITEIFCQSVKNLNSEYKESDNLKIIFKKFLLNNLSNMKNVDNIKLALDTFVEIGIPAATVENYENAEIVKIILKNVEHPTKLSSVVSQIPTIQKGLLNVLEKHPDYIRIKNFNTLILPSLKSIELMGQADKAAAKKLIPILVDTKKAYMSKEQVLIQEHALRALATVGKGDPDTVDAILSFIGTVVKTHRTGSSSFRFLQYQALESLYVTDKEKFNELTANVLCEIYPEKFNQSEKILDSDFYRAKLKSFNSQSLKTKGHISLDTEKNLILKNKLSIKNTKEIRYLYRLLFSKIGPKELEKIIETLKVK